MRKLFSIAGLLLLAAVAPRTAALGQAPAAARKQTPFTVEYYYKARWGYADEFLRLFQKNHYPVLKKQMELGRILSVTGAKPRYHATEDGRWDYRVTIVWKNVAVTEDGFDEQGLIRGLFPDQDAYRKEEQRRFEILLAHWDVPVTEVALEKPAD